MSSEQPQRGERGGRSININIQITPGSVLLLVLGALLSFILLAALSSAARVSSAEQAATVAPAAPAAGAQTLGQPEAQTLLGAYPLPNPNGVANTAQPSSAAPAVEVPSATAEPPSEPVGLELPPPPVFNPTRVVALAPPVFEATRVVIPLPVSPTTVPDLELDLDTPVAAASPVPSGAAPTASPAVAAAAAPRASGDTPPSPTATAPPPPPVASLAGTVRWSIDQSPKLLTIDQQIAPGATLIIEPGVEVQLAAGVSITVNGALVTLGTPEQPVRIVGAGGQRWDAIYGSSGSVISLSSTQLRHGGAGGTLIASEGGRLLLRDVQMRENFGQLRATDSVVEISGLELAGNNMPYGAALQVSYSADNSLLLANSRIRDNRLVAGAAAVQIVASNAANGISLAVRGNLLVGASGPALEIVANSLLKGEVVCNALVNGATGLSLYSDAPVTFDPGLNIAANAIEGQTPPIIPFYVENGIGRGATSALPLSMGNNWWDSTLGPYEPDRNADGRGEAVGPNISFAPWLGERPPCAPAAS